MKLEYIVGIVIILFAVQFFYGVAANPDSEFGGADGEAEGIIAQINPDYEPWFGGIGFEPPGGETESLLFALQAAFGAIIIGYIFGYYKGKGENN
ncbi:energy-coupling factor ABC transporter substrate-binding protein [Methanolobus halotolerans]|uniref:Cobalt transport protein CbiN n=1 Tax=Methanolobus halotolerans TaxID=2052935 RepID=A0A4E0QCP2_9EURY|nr:energy-coupling factor ABC transporter substrate-binding protein [Methanolobus halotolerans]TGC11027.1 energy-coupling factor ABC transporter substrate-binding protein [Methanolobus halotolerans]